MTGLSPKASAFCVPETANSARPVKAAAMQMAQARVRQSELNLSYASVEAPIAGVTGRAEIMDAPGPGGLGGTFAGNPLSCAAALAVLDLFERENLLARANELGDRKVAHLLK